MIFLSAYHVQTFVIYELGIWNIEEINMNVCRLFLSPLCSVLIIIKEQTNNAKLFFLSFFSP